MSDGVTTTGLTPEQVREVRERADLSQREFADALGVGHRTVTAWENGENGVVRSNAVRFFGAFPELIREVADA